MRLVECVPNFSEGRDRKVLDAIAEAIGSVDGVLLLDVDPGAATHRTVMTFVGSMEAVEEAAFRAIERAASLIDMRAHRGAHPRMGATDVCPFVPLGDTTLEECVELARRVGRRVGETLKIPVYLYEAACSMPRRKSLSDIRAGEYEGLAEKLKQADWSPDFGPAVANARSGATVIGARQFLIAYNVTLNTRDRRLANTIAQNIRETGRSKKGADGKVARDAGGRALTEPGPSMLACTRATGWYIEEYGRAQVSINLTDFRVTPPHSAFEAVETEAARLGLRVTGSEVVGLIPLEAMRRAGEHALRRQGKSPAAPEAELIHIARVSLGLDDVAVFDPEKKIIEYRVAPPRPLGGMTLRRFVHEVSGSAPAPGGGSVAALAGGLSAALTAMVAALTYEQKGREASREKLAGLGAEAQTLKGRLLDAVDADTDAFNRLMEALRLARGAPREGDERHARDAAVQQATRGAIDVPLAVMTDGLRALELAEEIAAQGAASALSDAGVAALAAAAAVEGAYYNVRINLSGLTDAAETARFEKTSRDLLGRTLQTRERVTKKVREALGS